jgi:hypothetical protein
MIENLATVITNLLSAIPWIGEDFVQLVYNTDTICMSNAFPVIGTINWGSRRGLKARTPEQLQQFLSIPYSFLAQLAGFIDGDGYISITRTNKGYIEIKLVIGLDEIDSELLTTLQTTLGLGRIYGMAGLVKYYLTYPDFSIEKSGRSC